jgi:hypothetical protein
VTHDPLVSVVINNFNYARFLSDSIESALTQTYPSVQVVVVDDGSTDDSRQVIARYRDVNAVLKENGGQASALNAGFAAAAGEIVVFLDADDALAPTAVAEAVVRFREPDIVKVHWPLHEVDGDGRHTGGTVPSGELPEGDLHDVVLSEGPASHVNPPTSGNAWARSFLERILPIPEDEYRIWADVYLLELAPLYGRLGRVVEPQGLYRLHGSNRYAGRPFAERQAHGLELYESVCITLTEHAGRLGFDVDRENLRKGSWFHRIARSLEDLDRALPTATTFVLADEDEWGTDDLVVGRRRLPFPERDGLYDGRPASDDEAVRELERLRADGASHAVFAWPALWWLDYYGGFAQYLADHYRRVLKNERLVVFDLRIG